MDKAKAPRRPRAIGEVCWTPEIKAMRKEANRLRRRKQRAYRKAPEVLEARSAEYIEARKALGT